MSAKSPEISKKMSTPGYGREIRPVTLSGIELSPKVADAYERVRFGAVRADDQPALSDRTTSIP